MSFQFILGRAGSGKTHTIINEITEKIKNEQRNIILIVPDQMTFQMEYELVKKINAGRKAAYISVNTSVGSNCKTTP